MGALALLLAVAVAWQLALARVPRNRAVLEQLVRERTGLGLSFGELGLRWGWYGPEAVFRSVRLQGDAGEALLRAPELIVGLDAWHVLHGAQLNVGRIRIVSADIDLTRRMAWAVRPPRRTAAALDAAPLKSAALQTLLRWHEGQVELDSATVRLPDPTGGSETWVLQLRQGAVRRAGDEWSAYGLVLLPHPLGRTARIVLRVAGDPSRPAGLAGSLRFEGAQLELGTWSRLLPATAGAAAAGQADIELAASFADGRITRAQGRIDAVHVEARPGEAGALHVPRLRAQWRALRRDGAWRLSVDDLDLGAGAGHKLATASLWSAPQTAQLHATLHDLPLEPAAQLLAALGMPARGLAVHGTVRVLNVDWSPAGAAPERLEVSGELAAPRLEFPAAGLTLSGTAATLSATERELQILPAGTAGSTWRLQMPGGAAELTLGGALRLAREGADLRLEARALQVGWAGASVRLEGGLTRSAGAPAPLEVRITALDVDRLRSLAGTQAWRDLFGPAGEPLRGTLSLDALVMQAGRTQDLRVAAEVHEASLSPAPALPPLEGLAGHLLFADGRLQRSSLQGRWLGGPLSLQLRERLQPQGRELLAQARGRLAAASAAAGVMGPGAAVQGEPDVAGNADWSGSLSYEWDPAGQHPAQLHWRAESALIGVYSRLADPFAKAAGSVLRLRAEGAGTPQQLGLRVMLGDRLASVWQIERDPLGNWQVERAAVRTGSRPPLLPASKVVSIEGRLGSLDLPAWLAAWRHLQGEATGLAVRTALNVGALRIGAQAFQNVQVQAESSDGSRRLRLNSASLSGALDWPRSGPAALRIQRLELGESELAALLGGSRVPQRIAEMQRASETLGGTTPAGWLEALPAATAVQVDSLVVRGRELGTLQGTLAAEEQRLRIADLQLAGAAHQATGDLDCSVAGCRLRLALQSQDPFAPLPELGLQARGAKLRTELQWQPAAFLATLTGQLHIELDDGSAGPGAGGLLAAPALVAAEGGEPLRFERLAGDFELHDGEAYTKDLQLEGTAEMLISGRVGLLAHDYDQRVWILRGEDRLPGAVRRLAVTPGVAAAWLSLRQVFTGSASDPLALHLSGSWETPVLGPLR